MLRGNPLNSSLTKMCWDGNENLQVKGDIDWN